MEKIGRYERSDLSERHKAALRLADAFVASPAGIGEELRAQLEEHFLPEQVVELTLDVIAWSKQKVPVALDLDAPLDPDRPTPLDFDREGRAVVGGAPFVSAADRPA